MENMKIKVFRGTWTLSCNTLVTVMNFMNTWNDPTVITDILPQTISPKTQITVQFLPKVMNIVFSQVWDSFPAAYPIIWYNSCGNFDDNSNRTRLAWSRGSRNWKNHQFILDSSSFGGRRQRRQPLNAPRQCSALTSTACQTINNVVPPLCLGEWKKSA